MIVETIWKKMPISKSIAALDPYRKARKTEVVASTLPLTRQYIYTAAFIISISVDFDYRWI